MSKGLGIERFRGFSKVGGDVKVDLARSDIFVPKAEDDLNVGEGKDLSLSGFSDLEVPFFLVQKQWSLGSSGHFWDGLFRRTPDDGRNSRNRDKNLPNQKPANSTPARVDPFGRTNVPTDVLVREAMLHRYAGKNNPVYIARSCEDVAAMLKSMGVPEYAVVKRSDGGLELRFSSTAPYVHMALPGEAILESGLADLRPEGVLFDGGRSQDPSGASRQFLIGIMTGR